MVLSVKAGDRQEFAIWPTADNQEIPDVYGNIVVWQQLVSKYGDYDVYVADINNLAEPLLFIIGDANDQINPTIYDTTIVWQDYVIWQGSGDWDIWAVDISDQANPQLFIVSDIPNNDEQRPAVSGNIIVWEDSAVDLPEQINIFGADVTEHSNPSMFYVAGF